MLLFESRTQKVEEIEEFLYELVKLYKYANPGVTNDALEIAVKRKFLNGISSSLSHNIVIFCNNPYNKAITRHKLLEHCRSVQMYMTPDNTANNVSTCTVEPIQRSDVVGSVAVLSSKLDKHIAQTNKELSDYNNALSAVSYNIYIGAYSGEGRGSSVNQYNSYGRGRGWGHSLGTYADNRDESRHGPFESHGKVSCYKCGQVNHYAKHCYLKKIWETSGGVNS